MTTVWMEPEKGHTKPLGCRLDCLFLENVKQTCTPKCGHQDLNESQCVEYQMLGWAENKDSESIEMLVCRLLLVHTVCWKDLLMDSLAKFGVEIGLNSVCHLFWEDHVDVTDNQAFYSLPQLV